MKALARPDGTAFAGPAPDYRGDGGRGMFRWLTAPTVWGSMKWCAYALVLIVPGSLIVLALWCLIRVQSAWAPADQYLAEASDLPDLERRMRVVERASGGPAFLTFNH